jgi:hypothetical protein
MRDRRRGMGEMIRIGEYQWVVPGPVGSGFGR